MFAYHFQQLLELFKEDANVSYYDDIIKKNLFLEKKINHTFNGRICSICIDNIEYGEYVHLTVCNHIYHHECLYEYVKKIKKESYDCPNCRKNIEKVYKIEIDEEELKENWTRDFHN